MHNYTENTSKWLLELYTRVKGRKHIFTQTKVQQKPCAGTFDFQMSKQYIFIYHKSNKLRKWRWSEIVLWFIPSETSSHILLCNTILFHDLLTLVKKMTFFIKCKVIQYQAKNLCIQLSQTNFLNSSMHCLRVYKYAK